MSADLSLIHLLTHASVLVQLVMFLLLIASVMSWTFIFRKTKELAAARHMLDDFEARFWSGIDLADLHRRLDTAGGRRQGAEAVFDAGFKNYLKLSQQAGIARGDLLDTTRRAMRVALNREADQLNTHLPFLATVGSISPFIGLFGTVWGIMNSFRALGNVNQATLAMVAPGISEALVATAMGLFAAIPAVIAYNRFVNDVERLLGRYDNFLEEFTAILQRQAHGL